MSDLDMGPLRFGGFELDPEREELRRGGVKIKLQAQPLKVLTLLAGRRGELVAREEIQRHVWGEGTFVDVEQGINVCIRQIRQVLGDSATSPRFVETVPRRGYRFLAPVEELAVERGNGHGAPEPSTREAREIPDQEDSPAEPLSAAPPRGSPDRRRWTWRWPALMALALAAVALVAAAVLSNRDEAGKEGRPLSPLHGAPPSDAPLLLVLPFRDLDASLTGEILGDGLTEELITELARRYGGRLGVIARTTSMKYRDSPLGLGEIAAALGVDYVLEGSVRRTGERVRVTAQLIRAGDQVHLWAGNYDRQIPDLLRLESEVSGKIGQALALTLDLVPDEVEAAATLPAAYEAYLEGLHYLRRHAVSESGEVTTVQEALARAQAAFERVIALDPGFAPAYVGLARALQRRLPPRQAAPAQRQALEKALALDDSLPEAHLRLAELRLYYDWDPEGARESFERALELSPGYAEAHHAFAAYYSATGRHEEALASVERAVRLDPLSPGVTSDVGWYFYFARRFDDAVGRCRGTLEIEPDFFWARECILLAALGKGDLETAVAQARANLEKDPGRDPEDAGAVREERAAVAVADPAKALESYFRLRLKQAHWMAREGHSRPSRLATLHMVLGEREDSLTALEEAFRQRSGWFLPFLPVHPLFDPLRDDPRFEALLRRITEGRQPRPRDAVR